MTETSHAAYEASWRSSSSDMAWHCLFVLPFWLKAVRAHLGSAGEPLVLTVSRGLDAIGHLPLAVEGTTACFLGIPEVCDYQDLVARPGAATEVMAAAVGFLKSRGVARLDLHTLRPDALALQALNTLAREQALSVQVVEHDTSFEMALPARWENYLQQLTGKQRHEVRRKIRRLASHGSYCIRQAAGGQALEREVAAFMDLFQRNRSDKAAFMTPAMAAYFHDIITGLARQQMLRLYFLDVDKTPAASVLCFDYGGVRYLYNSGYDARFQHLSVGVLSKIFSIRQGIDDGCRHYDLLKGAEAYKKRIGGAQTALYRCRVEL